MITDILKTILSDSGCTLVLYTGVATENVETDQSNQTDIVGIISQLDELTLEVRANAIHEHYNPLVIQVCRQVDLELSADDNEIKLQECMDVCKQIIVRLVGEALFKTITPVTISKVLERQHDANFIGWRMPIELYYLKNELIIPCE